MLFAGYMLIKDRVCKLVGRNIFYLDTFENILVREGKKGKNETADVSFLGPNNYALIFFKEFICSPQFL